MTNNLSTIIYDVNNYHTSKYINDIDGKLYTNKDSILRVYNEPVHLRKAVTEVEREKGKWIYVLCGGFDFMFTVNETSVFLQALRHISKLSQTSEYAGFDANHISVNAIGRFEHEPYMEPVMNDVQKMEYEITKELINVRLNAKHLIPLNRSTALQHCKYYKIGLYVNQKRDSHSSTEEFNTININDDLNNTSRLYTTFNITHKPREDGTYILLSNKEIEAKPKNTIYIDGDLKSAVNEIRKIRKILKDFVVCGNTIKDLVSIPTLDLRMLKFNASLAAEFKYTKERFDMLTKHNCHLTPQWYGINQGPFTEYKLNDAHAFVCSLFHENTADVITALKNGCEDKDLEYLWKLAIDETIVRSSKKEHIDMLTCDFLKKYTDIIGNYSYSPDGGFTTHNRYYSVVYSVNDTVIVKSNSMASKLLTVGDEMGKFKENTKDIPWIFYGYGGMDAQGTCCKKDRIGFMYKPRCNVFNESLLVAVDDSNGKVYAGFKYEYTEDLRIANHEAFVTRVKGIKSLSNDECSVIDGIIRGKKITSSMLDEICVAVSLLQ